MNTTVTARYCIWCTIYIIRNKAIPNENTEWNWWIQEKGASKGNASKGRFFTDMRNGKGY